MGNRASISIEGSNQVIYLHWNGGKGSVMAFIRETNRRYLGDMDSDSSHTLLKFKEGASLDAQHYILELYGVIRQFFSFSGDKKYRGRNRLSVRLLNNSDENNEDNKHYHVNSDGTIDYSKSVSTEDENYTKGCFEDITSFFIEADNLLLDASWGEVKEVDINLPVKPSKLELIEPT